MKKITIYYNNGDVETVLKCSDCEVKNGFFAYAAGRRTTYVSAASVWKIKVERE